MQILGTKWPCDCRQCNKEMHLSPEDAERTRDEILIVIADGCTVPYESAVFDSKGHDYTLYRMGRRSCRHG
jgi:hypothetical protein